MTDKLFQTNHSTKTADAPTAEQLGEDWIQAIIGQDFKQLAVICHPAIQSTLLLPRRIAHPESVADLIKEVEDWFGEYDLIQKELSRVAMVGEKLAIFYRLRCKESGGTDTIEQQLYCTIHEDRIEQLRLICSGFQHDRFSVATPLADMVNTLPIQIQSSSTRMPHANALLDFKAAAGEGSTCAMLTPHIKSKLASLSSGQVLEVHVDDLTAKEDIEAWSRLSGNILLKIDQSANQELVFYIQKK